MVGWRERVLSQPIQLLFQQMGIQREFSCKYTPEQKGVAERKKRLVVEAAQEMLEEKRMPKFYWTDAVQIAVYIQNRTRDKVSAHKLYFRKKSNLRHMRVFRSIAYVHVPDEAKETRPKVREVHIGRLLT